MFDIKYSFKRSLLIMYLIALVGICTYVPWEAAANDKPEKMPAGHTFIWVQPAYLYIYSDGTQVLGNQPESPATAGAGLTSRLPIAGIDYHKILTKIVSVTVLLGIALYGGSAKRPRS